MLQAKQDDKQGKHINRAGALHPFWGREQDLNHASQFIMWDLFAPKGHVAALGPHSGSMFAIEAHTEVVRGAHY